MEAFSPREAEEKRLAVVEVLKFRKNGIWSNSDLRVTTNTAVVVVMMRPTYMIRYGILMN
jgi:hypothetical protein